jgi:hydroxyacylglutathione hydrolase
MPPTPVAIQTISLPLVNSYLVRGERWLLVDSGAPGDEHRILRAAAAHGVQPGDIGLILLTHGHVDHFGGAAALRALTGAPVAVHHADAGILRSGRNPDLAALGWEGRLFRPFLPWSAPPLEPDIVFDDDFTLHAYGLDATILATPGHSPGSITLLLPDRTMIVGDLLRGGYLGGRLLPPTAAVALLRRGRAPDRRKPAPRARPRSVAPLRRPRRPARPRCGQKSLPKLG